MNQQNNLPQLPEEVEEAIEKAIEDLTDDQKLFMSKYQETVIQLCQHLGQNIIGPSADLNDGAVILADLSQSIVDMIAVKGRGLVNMAGMIGLMAMTIGNQLGLDAVRKKQANITFKMDPDFAEEAGMLFEAGVRVASISTEQAMDGKIVFGAPAKKIIQ